jgi:hypothetical protein
MTSVILIQPVAPMFIRNILLPHMKSINMMLFMIFFSYAAILNLHVLLINYKYEFILTLPLIYLFIDKKNQYTCFIGIIIGSVCSYIHFQHQFSKIHMFKEPQTIRANFEILKKKTIPITFNYFHFSIN